MNQKSSINVSIVVVSFNSKKELAKTLKSINSQIYKNIEVVVVDSQSNDGTKEYLNKNKNLYQKLIQKKDKGIYDGMNKGIKLCKGKWILFLNSGDIFYSKKILKKISKNFENQNDIIYGDTIINNNNIKYLKKSKKFKKINFEMPFCHQSVFVKKEILNKFKFDLKYKISADYDLFYKLFKKKFNFFKSQFVISEITSGGLSDAERGKVFKEYKKINQKYSNNMIFIYYDYLNLYFLFKKFIKQRLGNKLTNLVLKIKYFKSRVE